jgi:Ca2+-transporting ATPase
VSSPASPWSEPPDVVAEALGVDPQRGLTAAEARRRLAKQEPNLLRTVGRRSPWAILLDQLKSVIVALLGSACLLSAFLGDWLEAAAIAAVLVVNTLIGFVTELRAVRSMEALRDLGRVQARVLRGGEEQEVPAEDLVPGDLAVLEGGDIVTADMRLLEASKLQADESILTGESLPVGKGPAPSPADAPLAERSCMLFKGTALSRGSATAVVVATGMQTELGRIAALVAEAEGTTTPLEERLELLGRRLVAVSLAIAVLASIAGIASGKDLILMVETGIALAVAAIPEGLPVVATIALARGMWRLARRNALIRELAAVETLGETSVVLTDKTGTLTENRMTATELVLADGRLAVSGEGLSLTGAFTRDGAAVAAEGPLAQALEVCALCNNASLHERDGEVLGLGDPLEVALLVAAAKAGLRRPVLVEALPELREEAFDPAVKMMATVHQAPAGLRSAVKGAAEAVLAASVAEQGPDGAVTPLSDARRAEWLARNQALAKEGLRVLALAEGAPKAADAPPYQGLTFLGLVALQDPPRPGVREAVSACRRAGIRVVMATGDQAPTARTIGLAVGLTDDPDAEVVSGGEVKAVLGDPQRLARVGVFARVDPEQKLALVDAFQQAGDVVAMTGDGVNDAPALKKADIGVAMGLRGTQVAREAAEMVLRDDSLDSIVVAVRQGRVIFANIRKFVLYLLSCNMAEIGVIGLATLVGLPLPLLPLQILFLNLLTDVFPALALGFGEGDPGVMDRPPRDPEEALLTRRHWGEIAAGAAVMTVAVLGAMAAAMSQLGYDPQAAVSVSFLTLGFAQLWHVFNVRGRGSTFLGNDVIRNPHVWGALALCSVLLVAAAAFGPLSEVLKVPLPDARGWGLILGFSAVPWALGQIARALEPAPPVVE